MKGKDKIDLLDLVMPFCLVYCSFLCGYSYFSSNGLDGSIESVLVLFSCSFFFTYGVLAFFRDLKMFGIVWMIKSFRNIFKKDEHND